jgi:hypothetical protein
VAVLRLFVECRLAQLSQGSSPPRTVIALLQAFQTVRIILDVHVQRDAAWDAVPASLRQLIDAVPATFGALLDRHLQVLRDPSEGTCTCVTVGVRGRVRHSCCCSWVFVCTASTSGGEGGAGGGGSSGAGRGGGGGGRGRGAPFWAAGRGRGGGNPKLKWAQAAAVASAGKQASKATEVFTPEAEAALFPRVVATRKELSAVEAGFQDELLRVRRLLGRSTLAYRTLRTGELFNGLRHARSACVALIPPHCGAVRGAGVSSTVEYLLEFSRGDVPAIAAHTSDWCEVSTTKELVRYHTPAVQRLMQRLALARETLDLECQRAWKDWLAQLAADVLSPFQSVVRTLATLDALHALACVSALPGYVPARRCRPAAGVHHCVCCTVPWTRYVRPRVVPSSADAMPALHLVQARYRTRRAARCAGVCVALHARARVLDGGCNAGTPWWRLC